MRLQPSVLLNPPPGLETPDYDRAQQSVGIVHLGLGAFHRAHQAAYFDALMAMGKSDWIIRGASLRSPTVAEQLNPQDGLYTIRVGSAEGTGYRLIGAIGHVLVGPDDPAALVAAMADPGVTLVMLTVTEKGYHLDPASGRLRLTDPAIAADIQTPDHPKTAPGYLVAGLRARREAGLEPFTVLSCDNLSENGHRVRAAVLDFARAVDESLADWIEERGAFPCSMVDRIVPSTTEEDIDRLEAELGYRDEGMVTTEAFTQWVIEDHFVDRRPPLEKVGVQFTDDVAGWEMAKLRLLNGSHSTIAYLGALAGHQFVDEVMGAPGFEATIEALWDESQSTLDLPDGFDPRAYREALKQRFRNPSLKHRTRQIAMDGSQKLPQRLLTPLEILRARGERPKALVLAVAGWMRWQFGTDESGQDFVVEDPLAATTREALAGDPVAETAVRRLLAIREIFGETLPKDEPLVADLVEALSALRGEGAGNVVASFGADRSGR